MIKDLKAAAIEAAEARSYVGWTVAATVLNVFALAWAYIATPGLPRQLDETIATGEEDHREFETHFGRRAKTKRIAHAWVGTWISMVLYTAAAGVELYSSLREAGFFDRTGSEITRALEEGRSDGSRISRNDRNVAVLETARRAAATQAARRAAIAEAEHRERRETLEEARERLYAMRQDRENAAGDDGTVAETAGTESASGDSGEETGAGETAEREPTGFWAGRYGQTNRPGRPDAVQIAFGDATVVYYPGPDCTGDLEPIDETTANRLVYRETITDGRTRCWNGGTVVLTRTGPTTMDYEWSTSQGRRRYEARGTLDRQ